MFDWLFGNSTKNQLDQYDQQMQDYQNQINSNRSMGNAISGIINDPNNADLLSKITATNPNYISDLTSQAQGLRAQANQDDASYKEMQNEYDDLEKRNKYNYFGDGLLGTILNPIAQTATGISDLATGQYGKNGRDPLSDLGAAAEAALTFVPIAGGAAKALKVGKTGGALSKLSDLTNSTKGMIGTGALFGGADALRQGGSDSDFGDILSSAGTGAAFSAALPLAQRFLTNRGTNAISNSLMANGIDQGVANQAIQALPNRVIYQNALRSLIPKSTVGKLALGGGALYGGSQLFNNMNQQPTYDYSTLAQQYGGY